MWVADIEADADTPRSVKLRLAVRWGIKNDADLKGADLKGADLSRARLRGANFRGANLTGADLSHAVLDPGQQLAVFLSGAELNQTG